MDQVIDALRTGAGMLWKALWALIFGYIISAGIQVLITREQMARTLGGRGVRQAALAGFFGFVSSSCSFAALAASRAVWVKGAHAINAIAFLVASTNLVIELGIVLFVLLGWEFVAGNFLVGATMIVYVYVLTRWWFPGSWAARARQHAERLQSDSMDARAPTHLSWRRRLTTRDGWTAIAGVFVMEWRMVYKEILFGFTVAGFISVFVPQSFWNTLLLQPGREAPTMLAVLENAAVAPLIAFFTFIGSMGNVPLAAMLWTKGNSFGGVMAFLGADLVAATVLYIQARYYGWRYAAYLAVLLYVCMVAAGVTVHALFAAIEIVPSQRSSIEEMVAFRVDYTLWLNLVFGVLGAALVWLHTRAARDPHRRA